MRGTCYSNGIDQELVTPTGAADRNYPVHRLWFPTSNDLQRVGLGAGSRDLPIPNILRLWLGESRGGRIRITHTKPISGDYLGTRNAIDDLSPQVISYVFEALFAAGAVDVLHGQLG